jgi:3-hydroxyisobutyrate dehydrogenase-like beta-hydroxyacid dehydrogenase
MITPYHVAVIGLGAMGMGAARSCLRAGLTTYGIDLSEQARGQLQQAGAAAVMADARPLAETLDAVLLLVVNATQVRRILLGNEGLARHLKPGTAIMVSSTIAAEEASAGFAWVTRKLRDALRTEGIATPVITSNRINMPETAEQVLAVSRARGRNAQLIFQLYLPSDLPFYEDWLL